MWLNNLLMGDKALGVRLKNLRFKLMGHKKHKVEIAKVAQP